MSVRQATPSDAQAMAAVHVAAAAMDALRKQGFSEVVLWVLKENERARVFYEAQGFEADGAARVEVLRDGTELHEVRYRRSSGGR